MYELALHVFHCLLATLSTGLLAGDSVLWRCTLAWSLEELKRRVSVIINLVCQLGMWDGQLNKVNCSSQGGWASSNQLTGLIRAKEQKTEGGEIQPPLPHLFFQPQWLSCDLSHLPQPSDWDLHRWLPSFSGLWTPTGPACRQQIMGIFSLCNYMTRSLAINIYKYIPPSTNS